MLFSLVQQIVIYNNFNTFKIIPVISGKQHQRGNVKLRVLQQSTSPNNVPTSLLQNKTLCVLLVNNTNTDQITKR